MGRPKKKPGERFVSPMLGIRVPAALKDRIERIAKAAKCTVTDWLLPILQREADRAEKK